MLRKYFVLNVVSTLVLYACAWTLIPSPSSIARDIRQGFDAYAMDSALLGPVIHRIVTVTGRN